MTIQSTLHFSKTILILLTATLLFILLSCTQEQQKDDSGQQANATEYDSLLAKKYGADDYGMKRFVMAFLKRGPNSPTDSLKSAELQKAHLENINRMAEEGKLVLAGPFLDRGDIRGIYVFDVPTVEEAKALTESDPAIQYGSLVMELKPWYCSAGLLALNDIHKSLMKKSIVE